MDPKNTDVKESADRIRADCKSWSLEGDAEILKLMTNISNNLTDRGNKTTTNMHKMMLNLSSTSVELSNVTNKLLALQNSQFIENRVREEEEDSVPDQTDGSKTEVDAAPKELPLSEYVQDAFQNGVKMMNKFYDKVIYNFDDSDDETGGGNQKSVLYLPKNMYKDRSLPYIIGSKEWQENRHIGITNDVHIGDAGDDLQESAESVENDDSESIVAETSEDEKEQRVNDVNESVYDSNSDRSTVAVFKPPPVNVYPEKSSTKSSDENSKPAVNPVSTALFRPENFRSQYAPSNLFENEPPEISESESRPKERKPVNLFADDNSEDEYFVEKKVSSGKKLPSETIQPKPMSHKASNLLLENPSDDEDRLFVPKVTSRTQSKVSEQKPVNLFANNSSEDEDQLFSTQVAAPKPTIRQVQKADSIATTRKATNLFAGDSSDDDDQLFSSKFRNKDVKDKQQTETPKLSNQKISISADKNLQSKTAAPANTVIKSAEAQSIEVKPKVDIKKYANLFAGDTSDEEDPLFSKKVEKLDRKIAPTANVSKSTNLFAGSISDDDNKLFATKKVEIKAADPQEKKPAPRTALPKAMNLFAGNSSDDDSELFSSKIKDNKITEETQEKTSASKPNVLKSNNQVDNDTKIIEQSRNLATPEELPNSSLETKTEKSIDTSKPIETKATEEPSKIVSSTKSFKSTNLFGDDDFGSEDDLFAPKPKPVAKNITASMGKPKNILQEKIVDSTKTSEKKVSADAPPEPKAFKSTNLFGDDSDSDDGLFGSKPKSTATPSIVESKSSVPSKLEGINSIFDSPEEEKEFSFEKTSKIDTKTNAGTPALEESETAPKKEAHRDDNIIEEKRDLLSTLLAESPPDEPFDIFTPNKPKVGDKLTISSSFDDEKNIFDDEDFLETKKQAQDIPESVDTPTTEKKKTFVNYSSLHLFSDEPPDDDNSLFAPEPIRNITKRKLIGVFDDTNNVIGKEGANSESISNEGYSYMLFANEPPPIDTNDSFERTNKSDKVGESSKNNLFPKEIPNNIKPEKEISEPRKHDFKSNSSDINTVENLIKASKNKISEPAVTEIIKHKEIVSNTEVENSVAPLDSLNKTRAKISRPRRPSTRRGRQRQYEKYVTSTEEDESIETVDSSTDEKKIEEDSADLKVVPDDNPAEVTTQVKPRIHHLMGSQKELQSKIVSELKKRTSTLFKDSDDDDSSAKADSDWLSQGSSEVSDIKTEKAEVTDKKEEEIGHPESSSKNKEISGDIFSKDDKSNSLERQTEKKISKTSLSSSKVEIKKPLSLFGDDSSDEDFFDKHIIKSSLSTKKASSSSTPAPVASITDASKSKPPIKSIAKQSSSKLFGSSDDDDDLFLKTPSDKSEAKIVVEKPMGPRKVVPVCKKVVKTASLSKAVENPLADLFD